MKGRWPGIAAVWALAVVAAVVVVAAVTPSERWTLYPLVLGGTVVVAFAIQLAVGEKQGFVTRLMLCSVGSLIAIVLVSAVGVLIP